MELRPKSLNIPLERQENLGLILVAICVLASAIAWFFNAELTLAFIASCLVCLPPLWLLFLPPSALAARYRSGALASVLRYGLAFGYLSLAKSVIVPWVLMWIHRYA